MAIDRHIKIAFRPRNDDKIKLQSIVFDNEIHCSIYDDKYVGDWRLNLREGEGTAQYFGGAEYTGEWKNGKKHGKGTIVFLGGRTESGVWDSGTYIGAQ